MISDPAAIQRIETVFPFLSRSTPEFRARFLRAASLTRLESGQHICREGTACGHLGLLLSGTIRVYKLGENGREITLYRVEPGESCILTTSCILSQAPFPAFAACETPIEAVMVPAPEVAGWLSDSAPWREYVFGLVASRLTSIIGIVEEAVFLRVDRRIANDLSRRLRESPNQEIHTTHQEIASELGTSREVVSRILKDFETRGIIRTGRRTIAVLDSAELEAKTRDRT